MPLLTDLSRLVRDNDHQGFLKTYLVLMSDGYALSVPMKTAVAEVENAWRQILPRISNTVSDEFIQNLSEYWLSILKKQGGKVDKNFADSLLAIIDPNYRSLEPTEEKKLNRIEMERDLERKALLPDREKAPLGETVAPAISGHYYRYQDARNTPAPSQEETTRNIKKALKEEDSDSFLINYLFKIRFGEKIKVPLSSVLENIQHQWEEILATQFGSVPSQEFMTALCSRWFYWVNQKGLPSSKEQLEEILYQSIANYKGPKKPTAPKSNLLDRLFLRKKT